VFENSKISLIFKNFVFRPDSFVVYDLLFIDKARRVLKTHRAWIRRIFGKRPSRF